MPPLIDAINAFIIAGGKSRRFGHDKAFYPVEGIPLVERVLTALGDVFDDISIVADDLDRFAGLGVACHPDTVRGLGPTGGIFTALHHARPGGCFVVACDMPFLSAPLIRGMAELVPGNDVVIPFLDGNYEALHAFYSPKCLEAARRSIGRGERRVVSFFGEVMVRRVEAGWISRMADPSRVFININHPDDLEKF
ncbi:MAG TPA: molybdenum cofactor guanylyltransferase [Spirochaetota bacterium]|nr:molybdenum cofactor guanylyltransferase [Spirochaetota bacterium]